MTAKRREATRQLRVSAVIPTFNRREHVLRAVRSILSQSLPPDEILVVDDGSTDGTAEALAAGFGKAVRVIRQQNAGVSSARRRGIEAAQGDWIAFLDSDDEWTPERQAVLTHAASGGSGVDWVFGDTEVVGEGPSLTLFDEFGLRLEAPLTRFDDPLSTQFPFQFSLLQSSLIRRSCLIDTGAFVEGLRSSEDFLVSFRAALTYSFAAVPDVVTRLYRTPELETSSLSAGWRGDPDYFRARVAAFGEAAELGRAGGWGRLHAQSVRGLCRALADQGSASRKLSMAQFRHDRSPKAFAFAAAALLGPWGVRAWSGASGLRS